MYTAFFVLFCFVLFCFEENGAVCRSSFYSKKKYLFLYSSFLLKFHANCACKHSK